MAITSLVPRPHPVGFGSGTRHVTVVEHDSGWVWINFQLLKYHIRKQNYVHPPQSGEVNCVIQSFEGWSSANHR